MRNTLHIFRKDLRHLWPYATAVLLCVLLSAVFDPTFEKAGQHVAYSFLEGLALPLACWSLIIAAIHDERLIGDRQYWLTRPIRWQELLGEKALLIVLLVNVPLFAWHVAALAAIGSPVAQHLPALLWRQLFFTAFYLLPVAALAVVTRGIGQIILTVLLIAGATGLLQSFMFARFRMAFLNLDPVIWLVVALLVAVGSIAMMVIQYSWRTTRLARSLGFATLVLGAVLALFAASLSRPAHAATNTAVQLSLAPPVPGSSAATINRRFGMVNLNIWVRFDGLPDGVTLTNNSATLWIGERAQVSGHFQDLASGTALLNVSMELPVFEQMRHGARVHGIARFLVFGPPHDYPLTLGKSSIIPHVGVCRDTRDIDDSIAIACYSPDPRASVKVGTSPNSLNWIIPPGSVNQSIPTSADMMPLARYTSMLTYRKPEDAAGAKIMAADPLPPITVEFEFKDVAWELYGVRDK